MSQLARRYAKALFEAARDRDAIDAVGADLDRLAGVLGDEQLADALLGPDTPARVRRTVLEKLVADAHPLARNVVQVLLERRRAAVLVDLPAAFAALAREARGEVLGTVETAMPLSDGDLQRLQAQVARLVGKRVELTARENPDLLGGVRVRVGNTLYDGSVATALEELRAKLMEAAI